MDGRQILADLLKSAMKKHDLRLEDVAGRAGGRRGFSKRSLSDILAARQKKPPVAQTVRELAELVGEPQDDWVSACGLTGTSHHPFEPRLAVIREQADFGPGDEVWVIGSSRPLLEAIDGGFRGMVLRNLEEGVVYRYYYPSGGTSETERSYRQFREKMVESVRRPPLAFGCAVDHTRFPFFSPLHTIVHCVRSGGEFTLVYVSAASDRSGKGQEGWWYPLNRDDAKRILTSLEDSRELVADCGAQDSRSHVALAAVRRDYFRGFQRAGQAYETVRALLGADHDQQCVRFVSDSLRSATSHNVRTGAVVRYLDVGCGDGSLTQDVREALREEYGGCYAVAIDQAEHLVATAGQRLSEAQVRQTTFEEFGGDGTFDLITFVHSCYVMNPSVMRKAIDLLAPGGVVCVWHAPILNNCVNRVCAAVDSVVRGDQRRVYAEDLWASLRPMLSQETHLRRRTVGLSVPQLVQGTALTEAGRAVVEFCLHGRSCNDTVIHAATEAAQSVPVVAGRQAADSWAIGFGKPEQD